MILFNIHLLAVLYFRGSQEAEEMQEIIGRYE